MKRVNEVKIGDLVRSYDFEGNMNCYFEGIVESIDGAMLTFTAKTTKQVWSGKELPLEKVSKTFRTALPGYGEYDDEWTNRVVYA